MALLQVKMHLKMQLLRRREVLRSLHDFVMCVTRKPFVSCTLALIAACYFLSDQITPNMASRAVVLGITPQLILSPRACFSFLWHYCTLTV